MEKIDFGAMYTALVNAGPRQPLPLDQAISGLKAALAEMEFTIGACQYLSGFACEDVKEQDFDRVHVLCQLLEEQLHALITEPYPDDGPDA